MSDVRASITFPEYAAQRRDAPSYEDNPGRAFANGIMLSLPLWALIGLGIWSIV